MTAISLLLFSNIFHHDSHTVYDVHENLNRRIVYPNLGTKISRFYNFPKLRSSRTTCIVQC